MPSDLRPLSCDRPLRSICWFNSCTHTHASPIEVLSALADAQTEAVQTRSDVQALAGKGAAAAQAALDAGKLTKAEASEVSDAVRLVSKIT